MYGALVLANGSVGDRVLGQLGFAYFAPNLVDAKGLSNPVSVAIDTTAAPNHIYVADSDNNRVLGWNDAASFANGEPADLVIGQPDFLSSLCTPVIPGSICVCDVTTAANLCEPSGVAVDTSGNLYVSDNLRSRVLEYSNPFKVCGGTFPCIGGAANLVIGQGGSFTSGGCDFDTDSTTATNADLCEPTGLAVDKSGNLFVADGGNNRVLKYDKPLSSDTTAGMVFGQGGSFSGVNCNFDTGGGNPTANDLCLPMAVMLDGAGNLFVADSLNNRVLEYNAPLTTTANQVFGQSGSFTTGDCNGDTLDAGSSTDDLCNPTAVASDPSGDLYVADNGNSRVLEYDAPLTTNTTADVVFGQGGDFTSDNCNFDVGVVNDFAASTADDLCFPGAVSVDGSGDLFVADTLNSRVLEYNTPLTTDTTADGVLGQLDFAHQNVNLTDSQGLSNPEGVALDFSSTPNHLYVTDLNNHRVLGWRDASSFSAGDPADLVVGQPDFLSYLCDGLDGTTVTAGSLCLPMGLAVDGSGDLFVADSRDNRVLEFGNPFTACNGTFPCVAGSASLVLGQGMSFTSNTRNNGGISASSLAAPLGVAVDGSGNLFVADNMNNRVLVYNAPLTTGEAATYVFGQGGSFSSNACNFDTGGSSSGSSAIDLCAPSAVALDGMGNLYVADFTNERVLEYNTPLNAESGEPGAGDTTADLVFGQMGSFTSNKCNQGGRSASSICAPKGVGIDSSGNLYVVDEANNRVLEYNTPLTTDVIADGVFGQCGSFTSSSACTGVSANSLKAPTGAAVDSSGSLYVVDSGNNRLVAYDEPLSLATPSPTATATATTTASATATATPTATPTPVKASLKVSPKTERFPASAMGVTSNPKKVTVVNRRTSKQDLPITIEGAVATPPFRIDIALSTCHPGMGLMPGSGCAFFVTYTPSAIGAQSGSLTIEDNSGAFAQALVKLKGKGTTVKK